MRQALSFRFLAHLTKSKMNLRNHELSVVVLCRPYCPLAEFLTTLFKIETLHKDFPISPIDVHQILCNYM